MIGPTPGRWPDIWLTALALCTPLQFGFHLLDPGVEVIDLLAKQRQHLLASGRDRGSRLDRRQQRRDLADPLPAITPNSAA